MCTLLLLTGSFFALAWNLVPASLYDYDESDYMHAARFGWFANAFDSPSQSLPDFLISGWRQFRDPLPRTEISALARQGDDLNFYRHRHGPVHSYWLLLTSTFADNEQSMRRVSLAVAPLGAALLALTFLATYPPAVGAAAAVLGAAFFLLSPVTFPIVELAPHVWFATFCGVSLILLSRAVQDGNRFAWYASVSFTALAFCTLEVAFVPVFVLASAALWHRGNLRVDRSFVLRSLGVFFVTVALCWPAAIFKLAVVKAYLFMAYLAVARRGAWGDESLSSVWLTRLGWTPIEWFLIGAGLALWWIHRQDRRWSALAPFLLFALLMIGATLRVNSAMPRYAILFFVSLQLLAALGLSLQLQTLPALRRWFAVALLCSALAANAVAFRSRKPAPGPPSPRMPLLIQEIRRHGLQTARLLAPQDEIPTLHYYLPQAHFQGYVDSDPIARGLQNRFDAVILRGEPARLIRSGDVSNPVR